MDAKNEFDIVVIGGGIHGVGVAQAGAAAGYSVLLLEQTSLAAGTSSRSSKLIHGGLRYLETAQFRLVRESLHERELLLKLAPELVKRQRFFLPVYRYTKRRPFYLRLGLACYALLSGLRPGTGFRSVPRQQWTQLDGLSTANLQHVFQYWDAQTDDAALTAAVMQSALDLGAALGCPAEFESAAVNPDGCLITYRQADQTRQTHSATIVNAGGPWASQVADRITPRPTTVSVDLVQGSHLELPGEIRQGAYYLESRTDGRAVFVLPWKDRTLVGTTERPHQEAPERAQTTQTEIDYLLSIYQHYFPGRPTEILDQWAGLRVLPAAQGAAFRRSRETQLPVDNPRQPRVVSIFGGKLTGYRVTAEKVIRCLQPTLPARQRVAKTSDLLLNAASR